MREPVQPGSQSVDRALQLLALVGRETVAGQSLSAIVAASGLNKPTVRRLLMALMRAGLVEQEADGKRYHLGDEAFVLGLLAGHRHSLLDLAMPSLRAVAEQTLDTCFFSIRRDRLAVCLHREEGSWPVRTHALQGGDQHPLGVGAGSLAMLAALPDDEAQALVTANLPMMSARYPGYSAPQIATDIAFARANGFALNPGRIVANSWGVGVAVHFPDGRIAGALSVAAIEPRMQAQRQKEIAAVLAREARLVEARIAARLHGRRPQPSPGRLRGAPASSLATEPVP
jgi:DNA-binding IclR family transcriptional regulator